MRHKFLVVFFTTLAFVGCQTDILTSEPELPSTQYEFIASTEIFNPETKTSLTSENTIVWNKGDKLAIFQGANIPDTYQVKDDCHGKSEGAFSLVNDNSGDINGEFVSGMEIPANIAVYPYDKDIRCSGVTISDETKTAAYTISNVIIPANQVYTEDSFPQGAFTMVAVTESLGDHNLKFRNVLGALKLQLCGTCTVKSIEIKGNNEEEIAGLAEIIVQKGTKVPQISTLTKASKSITLDCGNGVSLNSLEPTEFMIAIPPTSFIGGFTITVIDTEDNKMPIKAYASNEIQRSTILKMTEVSIPIDDMPQNISFEDEVMKELCVNAFDTNNDGELSLDEAARVNDLSLMSLSKKTFKSFNEFEYFTSVTQIPQDYFKGTGIRSIRFPESLVYIGAGAFKDCIALKSIKLPRNLIEIKGNYDRGAFQNCSSLTSVQLPENLKKIGQFTFSGCLALKSISIPSNITEIGSNAFYYSGLISISLPDKLEEVSNNVFESCPALTTVTIPNSVKTIGESAFNGCRALSSVIFSNQLTKIAQCAFQDCESLKEISLPESLIELEQRVFERCSSLTSLIMPDNISIIPAAAFNGCTSLQTIILPEGLVSIQWAAFGGCSSLSSIEFPKDLLAIDMQAFESTPLTTITIPENVITIGPWAFCGCKDLKYVYIKCTSITSDEYSDSVFGDCPQIQQIYVPIGSENAYKGIWPSMSDKIIGYNYNAI